jgi:hypothetical protein
MNHHCTRRIHLNRWMQLRDRQNGKSTLRERGGFAENGSASIRSLYQSLSYYAARQILFRIFHIHIHRWAFTFLHTDAEWILTHLALGDKLR